MTNDGADVIRPVFSTGLGLFGSTIQLYNLFEDFILEDYNQF